MMLTKFGIPAVLFTDVGGLMGSVLRRYRCFGRFRVPMFLQETQHLDVKRSKDGAPNPIIPLQLANYAYGRAPVIPAHILNLTGVSKGLLAEPRNENTIYDTRTITQVPAWSLYDFLTANLTSVPSMYEYNWSTKKNRNESFGVIAEASIQ